LAELPATRRQLAEAYADQLLCEALSTVAARSIHLLTSELSVTSAVAKFLVPTLADGAIGRLGALLGARSYLADQDGYGSFQKLARDHRIVGIFDGNTLVNLYSLVAQFRALARGYLGSPDHRPHLARLFDLSAELPPLRPERLALLSRYGSSVLGTLPGSVVELRALLPDRPELSGAADRAAELMAHADELHRAIASRTETVAEAAAESFQQARAYALCFAGAACAGLWLHSGASPEALLADAERELWQDGLWLEAVLTRILDLLGVRPSGRADDELFDRLFGRLTTQYRRGSLFSLLRCPIAEGSPTC
jgi:hypothetical protein